MKPLRVGYFCIIPTLWLKKPVITGYFASIIIYLCSRLFRVEGRRDTTNLGDAAVHGEHRQVDGQQQNDGDDRQRDGDDRLHQRQQPLGGDADLVVEVVADDGESLLQVAGAFAHAGHFRQQTGKRGIGGHAARQIAALLHALPHTADGVGKQVVVDDARRHLQTAGDGQTGGQHGGHGGGELGGGVYLVQPLQRGALQLARRQEHSPSVAAAQQQPHDAERQNHEHKHPPVVQEEVGNGDKSPGDGRQVAAQLGKGGGEHGHSEQHDDHEHNGRHDQHQHGVRQGADQLGVGLGGFVVVFVEPVEAQLQRAGLLTGPNGLDKRDGESGAGVGKALGQTVSTADILGHVLQHPLDLAAAGLGRHHLHAPVDGQSGGQDDGELGAEDGQLLGLDAAGAEADTALLLLRHGLDLRDHRARLPQLGHGLKLIVGLDDAGYPGAVGGHAFVLIGGQGSSPRFVCRKGG